MSLTVPGHWYDGRSTQRQAAELRLAGGSLCVVVDGRAVTPALPRGDVLIPSRLGNTPRLLRFPDGGVFETQANDALDRFTIGERSGLLHALESRWQAIVVALVVVALFAFGTVRYGIPAAAEWAAQALPTDIGISLDDQVLAALDHDALEPTTLDEATRKRLLTRFHDTAAATADGRPLSVQFRSAADSFGPNALALPGGTIVFTDELVRLAQNDDQLVAVYAHEAGHVHHRHSLRQSLQASLLGLLAAVVVGDVSSVSSLVTAIPITLTELGYSRAFEREADAFAVATLDRLGLDRGSFSAILQRLETWHRCDGKLDAAMPCEAADDPRFYSYLSTHPATAERIAFIAGL